MEKELKTEFITLYVTPSVKKELEQYMDDDKMREKIIHDYFENEKNFIKEDIKELDDEELMYKATLIKIKNDFSEAHGAYVDEIERLIDEENKKISELKNLLKEPIAQLNKFKSEVNEIADGFSRIPNKYIVNDIKDLLQNIKYINELLPSAKETLKKLI